MLKIEELKQTIEKRFGICTYWTDHLGKDCIHFKNNGYLFDIYIDYMSYAERNMYMLQIDNETIHEIEKCARKVVLNGLRIYEVNH